MVWGVIRIAIFFGAFVIGLIIVEPLMPSVASNSLRKLSGTSLVVVCESGNMRVRHVSNKPDAVQLECVYSKILGVRHHNDGKCCFHQAGIELGVSAWLSALFWPSTSCSNGINAY